MRRQSLRACYFVINRRYRMNTNLSSLESIVRAQPKQDLQIDGTTLAERFRLLPPVLGLMVRLVIVIQLLSPCCVRLRGATLSENDISVSKTSNADVSQAPSMPATERYPKTLPSQNITFSQNPADIEFFRLHLFAVPLVPVGGLTSPEENRDLANAIFAFTRRDQSDDLSALLKFLDAHPDTVWRPALLFDIGKMYRTSGYISKALICWEEAWNLSKNSKKYPAQAIANDTAGELAEL